MGNQHGEDFKREAVRLALSSGLFTQTSCGRIADRFLHLASGLRPTGLRSEQICHRLIF